MAKGLLESAGVECMLVGENANNLIQAAFRVRLQVKVEDEAASRSCWRGRRARIRWKAGARVGSRIDCAGIWRFWLARMQWGVERAHRCM